MAETNYRAAGPNVNVPNSGMASKAGTHTAPLNVVDWIAPALLIVGGINWGLVGAMNIDLVASLLGAGSTAARIVYVLVGLSALWSIFMAARLGRRAVD